MIDDGLDFEENKEELKENYPIVYEKLQARVREEEEDMESSVLMTKGEQEIASQEMKRVIDEMADQINSQRKIEKEEVQGRVLERTTTKEEKESLNLN